MNLLNYHQKNHVQFVFLVLTKEDYRSIYISLLKDFHLIPFPTTWFLVFNKWSRCYWLQRQLTTFSLLNIMVKEKKGKKNFFSFSLLHRSISDLRKRKKEHTSMKLNNNNSKRISDGNVSHWLCQREKEINKVSCLNFFFHSLCFKCFPFIMLFQNHHLFFLQYIFFSIQKNYMKFT